MSSDSLYKALMTNLVLLSFLKSVFLIRKELFMATYNLSSDIHLLDFNWSFFDWIVAITTEYMMIYTVDDLMQNDFEEWSSISYW